MSGRAMWVAGVVGAVACGGRDSPPAQPIVSWTYIGVDGPVPGGTSLLVDQCLTQALPMGSDGEPDCVFLRATLPHGTATAATVAACQACNAPGEAPLPSSVPMASVSPDLATYDCLCVVTAQPPSAQCPPAGGFTASSPAAWCYATSGTSCNATPSIEFSPAASEGAVLYGACFAPGTFPVSQSGG